MKTIFSKYKETLSLKEEGGVKTVFNSGLALAIINERGDTLTDVRKLNKTQESRVKLVCQELGLKRNKFNN